MEHCGRGASLNSYCGLTVTLNLVGGTPESSEAQGFVEASEIEADGVNGTALKQDSQRG